MVTYLTGREAAEKLALEIGGYAFPLDLTDRESIMALADRIEAEVGTVQVLVHNAGMIKDTLLPFLQEKDWDEVYEVNLRGPFRLTKRLIKGMLGARWGRVISITSLSGIVGKVGQCHYSAAKAGLVGFTKTLAQEVARFGVTANIVAPGLIDTPIIAHLPEKKIKEFTDEIPLRRMGKPEEVAHLVSYIASEGSAYTTGQTYRIAGGLMMH